MNINGGKDVMKDFINNNELSYAHYYFKVILSNIKFL